ncbi:MAG: [protein-PII] uridylyltransferase [Verrucomicrobiota bacterium]
MASHLDKVLKHAEAKLMSAAQRKPVDHLDLYRNFLKIEEHRLLLAHKAGEGGESLTEKRSDLFSVVLKHLFESALESAELSHPVKRTEFAMALVAVGGYGRGQLCPYSDIDILFLYDKVPAKSNQSRFIQDVVEQVLYMLWDIGLKVGHASRTIDEAILQGREDFQTFTALLDARLLTGDLDLLKRFQSKFEKQCIRPCRKKYLQWRLDDQRARHEKNGGTVFVQEPHIKNGCGGLRDYQNLLWVARVAEGVTSMNQLQKQGWIKAAQRKRLHSAHDFLMRVRNQLHYSHDRASEILTLRAQGEVADALGYSHRSILRRTEALMKDYYQNSQEIYHVCNLISRRLAGVGEPSNGIVKSLLPQSLRRERVIRGFALRNGIISVPSSRFFSAEPIRILQAFQIMQQQNAELHPHAEARIRDRAQLLTRKVLKSNPQYREILFHILSQKGKVGRIVRAMHHNGVLGKLIPEFAPLTCLVQHEFYHRYTADEHTILCLEQLDRVLDSEDEPFKRYRHLFEDCNQPELLYLALILHDVGKAANSDHHEAVSVQKAVSFAKRMGINGTKLKTLTFLVDHHGSLNEYACRRNLEDPKTIRDFSRIVQDRERLQLLMLMSFADTQSIGDQGWSNWKEGLVWHLYRLTHSMLADSQEFQRKQKEEQSEVRSFVLEAMGREMSEEKVEAHIDALPDHYFNYRNKSLILQQLQTAHNFIQRQAEEDNSLHLQIPEVHWENRPNVDCSEVSIAAWDSDHLFSKICAAFTLTGLRIMSADIWTRSDNIVIDTFRVSTEQLTAASHRRDKARFIEIMTQALVDPGFNLDQEMQKHGNRRQVEILDEDILEPALGIDNESSEMQTVLHVRASDRMGLLYVIAKCIADNGYKIVNARISTEKGAALDAFYLTDALGEKITDRQESTKLLKALNKAITHFIS